MVSVLSGVATLEHVLWGGGLACQAGHVGANTLATKLPNH